MASMRARHVLLISDSCFSGSLFGKSRSLPPRITEKYYLRLYSDKSRWGLTSGSNTPVSDNGSNGHSVFAWQLLRELERFEKPFFTTQELYTRIAPIISNNSEQTPLCRPIRNTGDQGGEFIFVRLAGGSAVVEQQALQAAQAQAKPAAGSLKVESRPSRAEISIDGVFEGISPLQLDRLKPGVLTVQAEKSGYNPEKKKVRIRAGRKTQLTLILDKTATAEPEPTTGSLTIYATPADALVRILNIAPRYAAGMELAPGRYHIEVSRAGYQTHKEWLELAAGQELVKEIPLAEVEPIVVPEPVSPAPSVAGPRHGKTWTEPKTGMEFVYIRGGCFQMGSETGDSDEKPVHKVCVDGFWLGRYEVTQGQYRAVTGENPSRFKQGDTYPVETVSWKDAVAFAKKLSTGSTTYRLPTEAQWEYAARAGTTTLFAFGNCISTDQANYDGNYDYHNCGAKTGTYRKKTWAVDRGQANAWGLYNMHGNVWEWCSDWYEKNYYSSSPRQNPRGPSSGSLRIVRGGSWFSDPARVRSADRYGLGPGDRFERLGFRLAFVEGSR